MTQTAQTPGPIVRVENKLVGRRILIDETDQASAKLVTFPKAITIFKEINATSRTLVNGVDIDASASTYSDYFAFMTCAREAVVDAVLTARRLLTNTGSGCVVEAVMLTKEFGGIVVSREQRSAHEFFHANQTPYLDLPRDWLDVTTAEQRARADEWLAAKGIMEAMDAKPDFMNGLCRDFPEQVIYTTTQTDEQNLNMFTAIVEQHISDKDYAAKVIALYRDALTGERT